MKPARKHDHDLKKTSTRITRLRQRGWSRSTPVHNYHEGLEKHDNKLMAKAFTEDGTLALLDDRRMEMKVTGRDKIAVGRWMGNGPPPGAGTPPTDGEMGGDIWHFTGDDHFVFESPTRATHYGYWLDMRPGQAFPKHRVTP